MTRKLLGGLAALFMVLTAGAAHASLIGAEVNVSAYFPNSSTVFQNPGNRTVSGAVEYPVGTYSNYGPMLQVDIGADQMIISDERGSGANFLSASFNGFILSVVSGPAILAASLDASSTAAPFALSLVSGDVLVNFQGVGAPGSFRTVINLVTENGGAVPEPGSMALFALGLLALGFAMRRRSTGARA